MITNSILAIIIAGVTETSAFPDFYVRRNTTVFGDVRHRNVPLRVLPLGDSITHGKGSTDGNGYRELFVTLAEQGGPVQMIGSRDTGGSMPRNESRHDGWDGRTINAISEKANDALDAKPNLVLLLAGTNNMFNASQASSAPTDIRNLIDKIFERSPRAVVLAGTIPLSTWAGRQPLNDQYNQALEQIVNQLAKAGERILVVPINATVATDELVDGLHPNDDGYKKMAVAWVQGVNRAQQNGWFQEPEPGYVVPRNSGHKLAMSTIRGWSHVLLTVTIIAFVNLVVHLGT